MSMVNGFVDLTHLTRDVLEHRPAEARSLSKGSIAKVMSGQTKAHQDKLAAAALHAIEVEAWLRDTTSKWARIVPNSERGRRS